MKYGILNQRNPEYDDVLWGELDVLYVGGYKAMRRAHVFLDQLDGEKQKRYNDRLRLVSYIGYMGQIIDFFCASLFSSGITVTEAVDADDPDTAGEPAQADDYWQDFDKDADLRRTPFSTVLRNSVRDALLKQRALIQVDFPVPEEIPKSRAEEKEMGIDRGYVYEVPLEQLIDWEIDDFGCFKWCVLYETTCERTSPGAVRGAVTHTWTIWSMFTEKDAAKEVVDYVQSNQPATARPQPGQQKAQQPVAGSPKSPKDNGVARWAKYEITVPPGFKDWKDDMEIPQVDGGVTKFNRIPLLMLELPEGLWAGNHLGPMAREHWARRSYLVGAEARNMTAIGYVNLDTSGGAAGGIMDLEPDEKRALKDRNVDLVLPGALQYAEPSGAAYGVVDTQLKDLKDEMFRVAHQMAMSVDNSSSTMRRSGTSKQSDKKDVAVVLEALAEYAKDFAVEIYECIAQVRGEDDVVWTARGMDKFVDDDRAELIQEAVSIDLIGIPSPTWQKEYKAQIAFKLAPNLPPETQDTIRKEITEGVDSKKEIDDLTADQQKDDLQDTPTPGDQHRAQTKVAMAAAKNGMAAPANTMKGGGAGGGSKKNGKPAPAKN